MSLHSRDGLIRGQLRQLGELLTFRNDVVHPKDQPTGIATFVGLEHIERDTGIRIGAEQIDLSEMTGRRARFYTGDIVYGYLRPYLNKVWRAEFEGLCSVDQYVFKVSSEVDASYITHFLRSQNFLRTAPVDSTPGQLPRIRSGEIAETAVFLPPLHEQRRIAAILDQADDLRRKRRAALECLDRLRASNFETLFGNPVSNHLGFDRVPFGHLTESIQSGWSPVCLDRPAEVAEWGVLKLSAVTECEFKETEQKALPSSVRADPSLEITEGDILFSKKNTKHLVAACALVGRTRSKLMFSDLIYRIRLSSDVKCLPLYLQALLTYPQKRSVDQSLAGGSAGSMPNISKEKLRSVAIELPPLDLQRAFAARVAEIDKLKAFHRAHLAHLDAFFASLQHRAFCGEL